MVLCILSSLGFWTHDTSLWWKLFLELLGYDSIVRVFTPPHFGRHLHLPIALPHPPTARSGDQIALNGLDQYSGGGTFFPCLGRSLRPPEGHTLSFRGDILHGGDPLLKGVRYIIACFCYYDNNDSCDADGGGGGGGGTGRGEAALEGGSRGSVREAERNGDAGGGRDDDAGEGGRGIEFRSDKAFSFGFGFG